MAHSPTSLRDEVSIALGNLSNATTGAITPTMRLGVTGLSRSGKTVFITSLLANLLAGRRLAGFSPLAQGRFIGARLREHPDRRIPRFPFEKHLASLTATPPTWPASTNAISQIRIELKFQSGRWLKGMSGPSILNLDIVDYPGEWLLDLPLLSLSYAQWSEQALERVKKTGSNHEAKEFLAALAPVERSTPAEEPLAQTLAELFTSHLRAARVPGRAMSTLPPGRFLLPGDLEGSPALTFAPLPQELANSKRDSLYALMARRYEAYKSIVVRPFFRDHFARLDRQIVLVDALRALNAGADAITDLQNALTSVLACFRQGANNPLTWLFARKIDRVLFAATKADHVHHSSHRRLEAIIGRLVEQAARSARYSGAETRALAIASLRATSEGKIKDKGEELDCLIGTPEKGEHMAGTTYDGKTKIALFPGDLPSDPDSILEPSLEPGLLNFLRFSPPPDLTPHRVQTDGLPHIRLDRALDYLLEGWMK